jgi:H+/Cl- antiporter ClcA
MQQQDNEAGVAARGFPQYARLFTEDPLFGAMIMLTGIAGGLAGILLLETLELLRHFLGPQRWSGGGQFVVLCGTGAVAGLLIKRLGNPGGIDVLVDNIHLRGGWRDVRALRSLLPVSLLCIAAGGAAGPEAPLVQSNGCMGSVVGHWMKYDQARIRILTIAGMASGFSVLFGAPVGAAIFALEFLHREGMEYYEAVLPAAWGAVCGFIACSLTSGTGLLPVWSFPVQDTFTAVDILWGLGAGLAGGVLAMVFTVATTRLRAGFLRLPVVLRLATGGLVLAVLSTFSPYALTFGEVLLNEIVAAAPVAGFFLLAAVMKFLGTTFTVASGWRGGFIIPLFFIGACLARHIHSVFPAGNETVLMAALMAGLNAGVTKTPIGSTLVVTRMANIHLMPTTLLSAVVATAVSKPMTLIATQRARSDSGPRG